MNSETPTLIITLVVSLLLIAFVIAIIISIWKVYEKAGQPGWGSFIPIYNQYILLKIANKPWWWLFLYFIPFVNLIIHFMVSMAIAKAFSRSSAFGFFLMGLLPVIGFLVLGFGKSSYIGASGSTPPLPQASQI